MKVTLVQPKFFNIWESIALGYIGAFLKKHYKGELTLEYFQGYFDEEKMIIEKAADSDIIGFSTTSPTFPGALRIARAVKKTNPNIRAVYGGWHPSSLPRVIELDGVDQIVVGEGETAFLDIVNGNKDPVVYGCKEDIDNLPFPDRDLIKNEREINLCQEMVGERITSFQSCRVCPVNCAFCSEHVVTGKFNRNTNPIRVREAGHVLDEIMETAKKYKLDSFKFCDATWNTSAQKVIDFCAEKIKRGFTMPFECNIHAAFTNPEMFAVMKKANCNNINIGCESGSPRILKTVGKGTNLEKIKNTFKWSREAGLVRRAHFLLGMPEETADDIQLTIKLIEDIDPDVLGTTIICPYPGCRMYDDSFPLDYDWEGMDEYTNDIYSTNHLSNKELKHWQKVITEKFHDKLTWHNKVILSGEKDKK